MATSGKVILYRSTKPYWLVEAALDESNGLSIGSGNNDAEWLLHISPRHLERLMFALRGLKQQAGNRPMAFGAGTDLPDIELLVLLFENFGNRDANPFEAIKAFLREVQVPAISDHSRSM